LHRGTIVEQKADTNGQIAIFMKCNCSALEFAVIRELHVVLFQVLERITFAIGRMECNLHLIHRHLQGERLLICS